MPTAITAHRHADGSVHLQPAEGSAPVSAVLADGYRLGEGFYDQSPRIFGPPGQMGMRADEAIRRGVLRVRESNPPPG